MLIVSIDTSGRQGSIALCRGDASDFEVLQLISLEGGSYAAQLMPQIAAALQQNNVDKTEVDGFVVVSGPGSFTGLRVGLATVKGLCEVLHKPLATVSMLEVLAITYGSVGQTATALLDAGRSELYVGEYQVSCDGVTRMREYIAKLDAFADGASLTSGCVLTPESAIVEFLNAAGVDVSRVLPLQADQVGRIGFRKLLAGDVADIASVDVNYIRRSDAELFSTSKR